MGNNLTIIYHTNFTGRLFISSFVDNIKTFESVLDLQYMLMSRIIVEKLIFD
jgi:hypothetical protein